MKDIHVRDNVELRIFRSEHAAEFFDVTKKNNGHLREWLGWLDDDKSVADVEKYIEGSLKRLEVKEGIDWCIWYDGKLIGGIAMYPWDGMNKKTSLAYWLTEDFQGKGIMRDSLKVVIRYIFHELGFHRVEITCAVGNKRSSAIPKKLGFTFEGIARESGWLYDHFVDLEVYSLLSSDKRNLS